MYHIEKNDYDEIFNPGFHIFSHLIILPYFLNTISIPILTKNDDFSFLELFFCHRTPFENISGIHR